MKKNLLIAVIFLISLSVLAQVGGIKSRLVNLADMGNEPDEEQQMMHLLMCSNEFYLEGLIAVTGKYLHPAIKLPYKQVVHPELFIKI